MAAGTIPLISPIRYLPTMRHHRFRNSLILNFPSTDNIHNFLLASEEPRLINPLLRTHRRHIWATLEAMQPCLLLICERSKQDV